MSTAWATLLPAGLVLLLCAPRLTLGYFWDDFLFLTGKTHHGPWDFLRPDQSVAFYRPVSQGLYFALLKALDPSSGLLGHLLNALGVAVAAVLIVLFVSDLCGRRAGFYSGVIFAACGTVASLVAWISCNQDLLAIIFMIAALWLRNRSRDALALASAALAILCKEPAVAVIPFLVAWDWIVGRPRRKVLVNAIAYLGVIGLWAAVHPGIQTLLGRGLQSGATGYVGLEDPERWPAYVVRYVMVLLNLPPFGFTTPWPDELSIFLVLAVAALAVGIIWKDQDPSQDSKRQAASAGRVLVIGLSLSALTLVMPAILVRHWAPYFACIPAVGFAIAAGPQIARLSKSIRTILVLLFVIFGVWSRGIVPVNEAAWTESVFVGAGHAASEVRRNFQEIFPSFPEGSQVVVATASTGVRGINGTMIDNQALQVWYRDPSLRTVPTLKREPGAKAEFLVRITTDLNVISIDPETGQVRASGGLRPDWVEVGRPLRNYAREVAADGDMNKAIRTLDALSKIEPPDARPYNRRLVAMMLIAADHQKESSELLASLPAFTREDALGLVYRLLAEGSSSERLDMAAFEAFGLSNQEREDIRWMVERFRSDGAISQAAWWARVLLRMSPGDPLGESVVAEASTRGVEASRIAR